MSELARETTMNERKHLPGEVRNNDVESRYTGHTGEHHHRVSSRTYPVHRFPGSFVCSCVSRSLVSRATCPS